MTLPDIDDLLPLRPVVFTLLALLSGGPNHGYALMREANRHLGRRALLGPGTLYRVLKELRDERLIEETEAPAGVDQRRRYVQLTPHGRAVAEAEARRLADLLTPLDDRRPADPEGALS